MESNWRSQVNEFGLNNGWPGEVGLGDITYGNLVARDLTTSDPRVYLMQSSDPNYFLFVADFGGDRGWEAFSFGSVPSLTPHFPYGRPVPPD